MTPIELIGLIASITSLVLGVTAIMLSLHFYKASRSSEVETAKLQSSIKQKVEDLSIINNDLLSAAISEPLSQTG